MEKGSQITLQNNTDFYFFLKEIIYLKTLNNGASLDIGKKSAQFFKIEINEKKYFNERTISSDFFSKFSSDDDIVLSTKRWKNIKDSILKENTSKGSKNYQLSVDERDKLLSGFTNLLEPSTNNLNPTKSYYDNPFDFSSFKYIYSFFYEGSHKKYGIKQAIICFNKEGNDWGDGRIVYLKKEDGILKYSSTFLLKRIFSKSEEPQINKYYKAYHEKLSEDHPHYDEYILNVGQVLLFSFYTLENHANARYLFFANILANNPTSSISATVVGILKKINNQDIEGLLNKNQIDDWFKVALLNKRKNFNKLETYIFSTEKRFEEEYLNKDFDRLNKQYFPCSKIKGYYLGFYLRKNLEDFNGENVGGFVFVIMEIMSDGKAKINTTVNKETILYEGYISFPTGNDSPIKGNFVKVESKEYRVNIFLESVSPLKKMSGIISGYQHTLNNIFTSPIVFYKDEVASQIISDYRFETLIKKYKPKRIQKNELKDFFNYLDANDVFNKNGLELLLKIKADLLKIQNSTFDKIEDCFPNEIT